MALPAHAAEWMRRAEMDYIGPFVKAWAAFNAWYRYVSGETQERAMLEFVKYQPNSVRQRILPLLDENSETAEGLSFRQAVYELHRSLDAIHLEVRRREVNERISFRSVCLRHKPLQQERLERNGQEYKVVRVRGGAIEITITAIRTTRVRFLYRQDQYEPSAVYARPELRDLSATQRTTLRQFYDDCNPRPKVDLVMGGGPALTIGTTQFQCTKEDLLAGLVETIYAMRNALLHGEVGPDGEVLACYEPAYRIVLQFLNCVR